MPSNALHWVDDELTSLDASHLRRVLQRREGPQTATVQLGGQSLINFSANDYLALADDDRLTNAVAQSLTNQGWGAGASPLVTGRSSLHAELETQLAAWEGAEAALLFPTGYAANSGTIASLVGPGDVVFSDAKNHASIIDGCRLSGAQVSIYPHCDANQLADQLAKTKGARRKLIVTDGLFSMDGTLPPLPQIAKLAEAHQAMLMVDEAHATGVFGPAGRGASEHFDCETLVDLRVGTLSKAFGSHGGFVVGSKPLIDWLANRARPYVFSTAAPAALCAASLAALQLIQEEPHRRRELLEKAAHFRQTLRNRGWNLGKSESQIVPLYLGQPDTVMRISQQLREQGLLVPGIRPPSVPAGESLLRISLSWGHTPQHLEQLIEGLETARTR